MTDFALPAFSLVVALDQDRGIGLSGGMPWRLPSDMAYFKRITTEAPADHENAVIMGRKTYESIPERFRPLAGRLNVVLSRTGCEAPAPSVLMADSLDGALKQLEAQPRLHRAFVIGGGEVYRQALADPRCRTLYVTRIAARFGCDTYFPEFEAAFRRVTQSAPGDDNGIAYTFEIYERRA